MLRIYPYLYNRHEQYEKEKENRRRLHDYDTMVPLLISENEKLKKQVEALQKVADANEFP